MAQINNKNLIKGIIDNANLQISRDAIPNQLADKVVPVMEVNTKLLRRCNVVASNACANATSANIYVIPADKDFYLVACAIGVIKDVTSTSTSSVLKGVVNGSTLNLLSIPGFSVTIATGQNSLSFPFPLKIDKGTTITIANSTNVANCTSVGHIIGYLDDDELK